MSRQYQRPIDVERNMRIENNYTMVMRSWSPLNYSSMPFAGVDIQSSMLSDKTVPAVRVTMPIEEFEELISIYRSHYRPQSDNPAVIDAWNQYKMLLALTK